MKLRAPFFGGIAQVRELQRKPKEPRRRSTDVNRSRPVEGNATTSAIPVGKIYFSSTNTIAGKSSAGAGYGEEITVTAAGRALLDDPDAATQRTTMGLGSIAVKTDSEYLPASVTKAQLDSAVSDGNVLYVGDVTSYSDEAAQDAVGAMIDSSLTYVDATPLLQRSALTGAISAAAGSNTTALSSFTKAQLDAAVSDGNVLYVGDAPTAHASSHQDGGSDAIALGVIRAPTASRDVAADYSFVVSEYYDISTSIYIDLAASATMEIL